jgi:hypothetical protein
VVVLLVNNNKKCIHPSLALYISIILVTGSLFQISSTILFENNDHILKIQSIYAGDGGGDGGGGTGVRGTTEESVASTVTAATNATATNATKGAETSAAATNATKGTETSAAAPPTQQEGTQQVAPPTQQEGTQQAAPPTQESTEKGGNILDQIWRTITGFFK